MALNFPDSPANGEKYLAENGIEYTYNLTNDSWTGALTAFNVPINPVPSDVAVTPAFGNPSGTNPGSGTAVDPYIITTAIVPGVNQSTESDQLITITKGKAGDQVVFTNNTTPTTISAKFTQPVGIIDGNGKWSGKLQYNDASGAATTTNTTYTGELQCGESSVYFKWQVEQQAIPPMVVTAGSVLSGESLVGSTLTASQPTVSGGVTPYIYTYQWQISSNGADFSSIADQNTGVYIPLSNDIGKYVRCSVTVTDSSLIEVSSVVSNTAIVNIMSIAVTLSTTTPKVGDTITATAVTSGGVSPVTTTYQWRADEVNIVGQTSTSLIVIEEENNKRLTCLVTTTDSSGTSASKSSDPTDPVTSEGPPEVNTVTLTELTPDSADRFTDQQFTVAVDMTSNNPESNYGLRGTVSGSLTVDIGTTVITDLTESGPFAALVFADATGLSDVNVGEVVVQSSGGTPITSKITNITNVDGTFDDTNSTAFVGPYQSQEPTVVYGNGMYVAIFKNFNSPGNFKYSSDCKTWATVGNIGGSTNVNPSSIAFGNGIFIASGWNSSTNKNIFISSDGINWTESKFGTTTATNYKFQYLGYGNGAWVGLWLGGTTAGNQQVWRSTDDGASWVQSTITKTRDLSDGNYGGIAYGNGVWNIALGNNQGTNSGSGQHGLLLSTDNGLNFVGVDLFDPSAPNYRDSNLGLYNIVFGNNTWVMVGINMAAQANTQFSTLTPFWYSYDGINWINGGYDTEGNRTWTSRMYSLAFGNGRFTAGGDKNALVSSEDGINWTNISDGQNGPNSNTIWVNIAVGVPVWLLSGNFAKGSTNYVYSTSPNGGGNSTVLTLTNDTNLDNLRAYDLVSDTTGSASGKVSFVDTTSVSLVSVSGTWATGTSIIGPTFTAASGVVGSISSNTMILSSTSGRWLVTHSDYDALYKLNKNAIIPNSVQQVSSLYTVLDASGNITDLSADDPGFVDMVGDPTYTTTFPSIFPSGISPDAELPSGVKYQIEVKATNDLGSDTELSNEIMPTTPSSLETSVITANNTLSSWNATTAAANGSWNAIAFGNNTFVSAQTGGSSNQIMTSPDGKTWTGVSLSSGYSTGWRDVGFGNNRFVAVSSTTTNRVMYSTDNGANWTQVTTLGGLDSSNWSGVAYGNGTWVAVANSGSNRIMYSTDDGASWTGVSSFSNVSFNCVAYGNGKFVAMYGSVASPGAYSSDGISWTAVTSDSTANLSYNGVVYGGDKFVALNGGAQASSANLAVSSDGTSWTTLFLDGDLNSTNWQDVTYGNGLFVAVGYQGTNNAMYSADGLKWTPIALAEINNNNWWAIAHGAGVFASVIYGSATAMWSSTGTNVGQTELTFTDNTSLDLFTAGDQISSTSGGIPITSTITAATPSTGVVFTNSSGMTNPTLAADGNLTTAASSTANTSNDVTFMTFSPSLKVNKSLRIYMSATDGPTIIKANTSSQSGIVLAQATVPIPGYVAVNPAPLGGYPFVIDSLLLRTTVSDVTMYVYAVEVDGRILLNNEVQNTFAFTNDTNLANFRIGDAITETGGDATGVIIDTDRSTYIKASGITGTWNTSSTITGPGFSEASGIVSSIDTTNNKMTLSSDIGRFLATEADYNIANKLNQRVKAPLALSQSNSSNVALFNTLNTSLTAYSTDRQTFVDALRTKIQGLALSTAELSVLCNVSHTLIKSYVVTVASYNSANKFYLNGVLQATIALKKGTTYIFDQDDASNTGHPLKLYTDATKTTEYTSGVTFTGTPGSALARTIFLVPSNAPATLYYQCGSHALMGGLLNIS